MMLVPARTDKKQDAKFKAKSSSISNHVLLWHGSRIANWAGILGQGPCVCKRPVRLGAGSSTRLTSRGFITPVLRADACVHICDVIVCIRSPDCAEGSGCLRYFTHCTVSLKNVPCCTGRVVCPEADADILTCAYMWLRPHAQGYMFGKGLYFVSVLYKLKPVTVYVHRGGVVLGVVFNESVPSPEWLSVRLLDCSFLRRPFLLFSIASFFPRVYRDPLPW